MPVDILIAVRNEYLLFRQCLESVKHKIPREDINNIIVVDDHSTDTLLRRYTSYMHQKGEIKLFRNGIPLPSFYSGIPIRFFKSKGHGCTLNRGLKHVTTDIVFFLDQDCIVLRGDIIEKALKCFALDDKIMAVGQLVGAITGTKVIGERERKNPPILTDYIRQKPEDFGFPNAICMFARMDSWRKHNLGRFKSWGWAHAPFARSIFEKGFKTCNFDTFHDGYVMHLGHGACRSIRLKWIRNLKYREGRMPYGMSAENKDYENKYQGEINFGYHELKIPSSNYDDYLVKKYLTLPFDQIAPPVDSSFFGPPDDSRLPSPKKRTSQRF
jgi:glycosyltransferase involved in cell wall biosynthesis